MVTTKKLQSQAIFRAIADPTRRQILNLLRERPHAVGEIASNFRTSRPAISKHLRLLKSAGLVVAHQRGTARICRLNARPLHTVNDWLRDYQVFWSGTLRELKNHVEEDR
ncbi:MAG: ArsR/SmtB family transcription factor [Steroidobacteraceae bacterium]